MASPRLPEPIFCLALDAIERIQGGEDTVCALWSVFSRVKDSVENGPRLENMSWRLWYCARIAPRIRPSDLFSRPLSSPSLSFSSSSEGNATSSDWDPDTTVVEDDDLPVSAGTDPVVSPLPQKHRPSGPTEAPTDPHQFHSSHQRALHPDPRHLPPPQSGHPPHVSHGRPQPSSHPHHSAIPAIGLVVPSVPHVSNSSHVPNPSSPLPIGRSAPSASNHSTFSSQIFPPLVASSSVPITLPSMHISRKDSISVGQIIADLFPGKKFPPNSSQQSPPQPQISPQPIPPQIIEPDHPSTPVAGRSTSTCFGNISSSSTSSTTSVTTTPRQGFPTVVVVNPTPHPTPPATPSPGASGAFYGLKPTATLVDPPEALAEDWTGGANGQLATPVSLNGDSRPAEPVFVMVEPRPQLAKDMLPLTPSVDLTLVPLQMSPMPAAAITFPEKSSDMLPSHPLTPSSNPSEISNSSKSTRPSAVQALEDKKFFLLNPVHSSSGHESSESHDSQGGRSISPQKPSQLCKDGPLQPAVPRDDEVASSFSAGSPGGLPSSVASSRGALMRHKGRAGFNVAVGSRRRQGLKKIAMTARQSSKKEMEIEVKETAQPKAKEEERMRSKGKERAVGERSEPSESGPSTLTERPVSPVKPQQKHHSRPSPAPQQPPQNLRQLPTNPPRPQAQPPARPPASETTAAQNTGEQQPLTRQLPFHPQLTHLGLGHLPTVPPRQRRPIEITETSSEYETTDTDESSWESESVSGGEAGEGEERPRERQSRTSGGNTANRTRDAGEFQRDAEREAQRARELFQKLPPRSYSHIGQLPRTKSGLSQLFHPDPQLFPEGHPYRTSRSSRDILARNWSAPGPPLAMMTLARPSLAAGPVQAVVNADPVVMSVNSRLSKSSLPHNGYRRRGPPQDQEQETDSGEDDPEDTIQVSSSVAQRRLAAIMGQRTSGQSPQQRAGITRTASHPESQDLGPQTATRTRTATVATATATAPMLMHPYLPDPTPLQTPHTIRRNIIAQELDEELRRNLLWERSQNQIVGRPPRAAGSILPGPWRPQANLRGEERRETHGSGSDVGQGRRSFATQRTKSWAGDYHASGW